MVAQDYKREVTHTEYRFINDAAKKVGIVNKLDKEISHLTNRLIRKDVIKGQKHYKFVNDKFIQLIDGAKVFPIMLGVFFLFLLCMLVGIIFTSDDEVTNGIIVWLIILSLGVIFFIYYYFTMPKKETIYNREDGLVTFPGFMWHKNITMSIHTVQFAFSQPSAQGQGAYQLRIVRPDKMLSQEMAWFAGNCYEDLSLILWYMDKNRPLPPGDGFDEFREKDFERRKAAGFPKPLFPSAFETPEATSEQQAERERIGQW